MNGDGARLEGLLSPCPLSSASEERGLVLFARATRGGAPAFAESFGMAGVPRLPRAAF